MQILVFVAPLVLSAISEAVQTNAPVLRFLMAQTTKLRVSPRFLLGRLKLRMNAPAFYGANRYHPKERQKNVTQEQRKEQEPNAHIIGRRVAPSKARV